MKSYRKAQGLSINTIIIAALGLAVLVILFAVFTGRIGVFNKSIDDAQKTTLNCNSKCITYGNFKSGEEIESTADCPSPKEKIFGSGTKSCCCTP